MNYSFVSCMQASLSIRIRVQRVLFNPHTTETILVVVVIVWEGGQNVSMLNYSKTKEKRDFFHFDSFSLFLYAFFFIILFPYRETSSLLYSYVLILQIFFNISLQTAIRADVVCKIFWLPSGLDNCWRHYHHPEVNSVAKFWQVSLAVVPPLSHTPNIWRVLVFKCKLQFVRAF